MTTALDQSARLAVLIDADNASKAVLAELFREIAKYGTATVKRAYGDWSSANLSGWKDQLLHHSVNPVQQFAYTKGKGCTDAALIIDAMDLLHLGKVDAFCIVSSDSDFTPLVVRLRESGAAVYGFGERKTPEAFRNACNRFIFTDILKPAPSTKDPPLKGLFLEAVTATLNDQGWSDLGGFGNHLRKIDPSFDSRTFGCSKLIDLVKKQDYLEVKLMPPGKNPHVRIKARKKASPVDL
jgi:uncharacterized LabA/DUF88 family protein